MQTALRYILVLVGISSQFLKANGLSSIRLMVANILSPTRIAFKGSCLTKAIYPVISMMFCSACFGNP